MKLFYKKNTKQTEVECKNLTKYDGCSLIEKIKELQQELDKTKENVISLETRIYNLPNLSEMFLDNNIAFRSCLYLYSTSGFSRTKLQEVLGTTISKLSEDKYQKIIDEISAVRVNCILLEQEKEKEKELREQIKECKEKLGIQ